MTSFQLPAAQVYDTECFPNWFYFATVDLYSDQWFEFTIADWRDDRAAFLLYLQWLRSTGAYQVGFNNLHYDYPLLHFIMSDISRATPAAIYERSQQILHGNERMEIWQDRRYIKQIDLFKIHHFDNKAKTTSLKALQVNMRSPNVMESPIPFGTVLTPDQAAQVADYGRHDVSSTKRFAEITMPMIEFRYKMQTDMSGDVLSFNDTKLGKQLMIQRLGNDICYEKDSNGKRQPRQTFRHGIALNDIILPYIQFQHPGLKQAHDFMRSQTIYGTKGVINLKIDLKGMELAFGTGGIHGSVKSRVFISSADRAVFDDDVASLYPSVAIVNGFHPEHLGQAFIQHYSGLKSDRFKHKKGTPQNTALKLALNGVYGDSNEIHSVFYDPKFTMSITINGQMLLCLFAEWLLTVPTLELIQINTDGVTYAVDRAYIEHVERIRQGWQQFTALELEQVEYNRMFIRDVNNYVAETSGGKLKMKGAYWTPDKHPDDIQNLSPTGWYRDYSADICAKAAVACMTKGADIASFIYAWIDPFDFMLRQKARGGDRLYVGGREQQKVLRYYMALGGEILQKTAPVKLAEREGWFKPGAKTSDADYLAWHAASGNIHNPDIHTKNKSIYGPSTTHFHNGHLVRECNLATRFSFADLDYAWYIKEAEKLVIR